MLRSATVEDEVLIGEKCVLMEGSLVENHCILAPGTVLPPGRLVPSGQLWAGNPAKFVRNLTKDEVSAVLQGSVTLLNIALKCESALHADTAGILFAAVMKIAASVCTHCSTSKS